MIKTLPAPAFCPGKAHLVRGVLWNELLAAVRARTHLNPVSTGPAGHRGVSDGAAPVIARLATPAAPSGRICVLRPRTLAALTRALVARTPAAAGARDARGYTAGSGSVPTRPPLLDRGAASLEAALRAAKRATPHSPVSTGPSGYRLGTPVERVASVEIWVQLRSGHSRPCFYVLPETLEDGYITKRVTTFSYENGSYAETFEATGAVEAYGPSGSPGECGEITFSTTQDGGFDYGAFLSQSDTDTLVDWSAATAAAVGAVADSGAPFLQWSGSWTEPEWPVASTAARSEYVWTSESLAGYVHGLGVLAGWNVVAPKFQIINTGRAALKVTLTATRASDSTEEVEDITVARGSASAWLPVRFPAAGEQWSVAVTRVRMGPFAGGS